MLEFVQGPDFPTGGVILHSAEGEGLVTAYSTGRGHITVQASAHLEEMERGRNRIIVSELPYMTNKASLIERIAELARETRIEGIVDLRDESDRQGMRIVIELSKTADPDSVLRDLYKHTPMQTTFSINMLALVDGEPRTLSLKQALRVYIEHRLEVVRRRSLFELEKARQRAPHPGRSADRFEIPGRSDLDHPQSTRCGDSPDAPDQTFQTDRYPGSSNPGYAVTPPGCPGAQEN